MAIIAIRESRSDMTLPIAFFGTNESASVGVETTARIDQIRTANSAQLVAGGASLFEAIFLKQLESAFSAELPHKKAGREGRVAFENPTTTIKRSSDRDSNLMAVNPLLTSVVFEPQQPPMPAIDLELLANSFVDSNRSKAIDQSIETAAQTDEQTTVNSETSRAHSSIAASTEDSEVSFESAVAGHRTTADSAPITESQTMPSLLNVSQMAAAAKLMTMSSLGAIPKSAGSAESIGGKSIANLDSENLSETDSKAKSLANADAGLHEELEAVHLENLAQRSNQRQYEVTDLDGVLIPASELHLREKNSRKSLADDLASAVRDQIDPESMEDSSTIRFELNRPELGLIKVQISIANKVVSLRITTENDGSRQIVTQETSELRQALTRGGLVCGQILIETAAPGRNDSSAGKPLAKYPQSLGSIEKSSGLSSGASRGLNFVA